MQGAVGGEPACVAAEVTGKVRQHLAPAHGGGREEWNVPETGWLHMQPCGGVLSALLGTRNPGCPSLPVLYTLYFSVSYL